MQTVWPPAPCVVEGDVGPVFGTAEKYYLRWRVNVFVGQLEFASVTVKG